MKLLLTISFLFSLNALAADKLKVDSFTVSTHGYDNYVTKIEFKDGKVFARITECWKSPVKDIPVTLDEEQRKEAAHILRNEAILASDQTPQDLQFGGYAFPTLTVEGTGFHVADPTQPTKAEIYSPIVLIKSMPVGIVQTIHKLSHEICNGLMRPKHEGIHSPKKPSSEQ